MKGNAKMENRFYVYEWYNIDTGEIFYVGKGTKRRKTTICNRNIYFKRYYNKYNCAVRVVQDNMSNKEALNLEIILIKKYKLLHMPLTNLTDGGENPPILSKEANGMYGKTHTEEVKKILHDINIGIHKGENNSQYGVSPKDRMDEETYKKWKEHFYKYVGENNPQYGISPKDRMDEKTYEKWREKQKERKFGYTNPNAKRITMIDDNNNIYYFDTIKDCAIYLIKNGFSNSKNISCVRATIWSAKKNNKKVYGFIFQY